MRNLVRKTTATLMAASALALTAHAGTLVNTFDAPFNYLANGIVGDTSWDGVYMRFGDVPNGNAGGNGNGQTFGADTTMFPGFLVLDTGGTDWSGAGNDGFFLYRVVSGDFDVSVEVVPPYDARGANFVGLMARAYHTNNSGRPFSANTTNALENWVGILRMNQFNFDSEVRQATNGANQEFTIAGSNADTNTSRFYRITRVGNLFSFYFKTNSFDDWFLVTNANNLASGSINRTDLDGVPMQVGIQKSAFNTARRQAYFDNFELTGPNVSTPAEPAAPSNVIVSSPNPSGSVNISWTPGAGSDGSLVLVRANGLIISQPVHGRTYTANSNFSDTNTTLSAGNSRVVYAGNGNSVTVSGLGGTNNTYSVAVFSYSGADSAIVYNRESPATNTFIGPGQVQSVSFVLNPSSIPVGGAASATVTATYTSGDSYDVSSDTSTVWSSGNPAVAIAGNGVVTGVTNGTATISATYANVTGQNDVTVHTPAFLDSFNASHNFITNGIVGTHWDGVYLGAGEVPLQIAGNLGPQPGVVSVADSGQTTNGLLTVTHRQTGWEGNENDGFFLFKTVPGDFQVAVKIDSYQNQAFHFPGLMARLFSTNGAAAGTTNTAFPNGRENHVRWTRFDEFGISTSARRNLNGGNQVSDQRDSETTAYWLLMVRRGPDFFFYKRTTETEGWTAVPEATRNLPPATNGAPMQVGIGASTFDSGVNFRTVTFSDFMLDAAGLDQGGTPPPPASAPGFVSNPNGTLTINWTPGAGSDGSLVVLRAGKPVSVEPQPGVEYTASSVFGAGSQLGAGGYVVHSGPGNSVTVSGLLPNTTYYAVVFSFSGTGETAGYNVEGASQGSILVVGAPTGIALNLPDGDRVAQGGVLRFSAMATYTGGTSNDVSADVEIHSTPEGAVVGRDGYLTGLTNGTVSVSAVFAGLTNSAQVTVYTPDYRDQFNVARDYLNGAAGIWDGVYLGSADAHPNFSIPGTTGPASTSTADANISSNGVLTVTAGNNNWSGAGNTGFFLWRYVPGDFQTAVQVASLQKDENGTGTVGFLFAGLMARAFGNTNSMSGEPYNGSEDWVYLGSFHQFNVSVNARHALNGADTELPIFDGATNDFYLLIKRDGGTFTFFRRGSVTEAWEPLPTSTIVRPDLAEVPMQVGMFQATYSASVGTATFADFMLDEDPVMLEFARENGGLMLSWPAAPVIQIRSADELPSNNWQVTPVTPGVTNGIATDVVPIGTGDQFFRLGR